MGPRPDGRGKAASAANMAANMSVNGAAARRPRKDGEGQLWRAWPVASMGPRPDGRGKMGPGEAAGAALGRQWGRGQTAAERGSLYG